MPSKALSFCGKMALFDILFVHLHHNDSLKQTEKGLLFRTHVA